MYTRSAYSTLWKLYIIMYAIKAEMILQLGIMPKQVSQVSDTGGLNMLRRGLQPWHMLISEFEQIFVRTLLFRWGENSVIE